MGNPESSGRITGPGPDGIPGGSIESGADGIPGGSIESGPDGIPGGSIESGLDGIPGGSIGQPGFLDLLSEI